jgi:hypothetical protein
LHKFIERIFGNCQPVGPAGRWTAGGWSAGAGRQTIESIDDCQGEGSDYVFPDEKN